MTSGEQVTETIERFSGTAGLPVTGDGRLQLDRIGCRQRRVQTGPGSTVRVLWKPRRQRGI